MTDVVGAVLLGEGVLAIALGVLLALRASRNPTFWCILGALFCVGAMLVTQALSHFGINASSLVATGYRLAISYFGFGLAVTFARRSLGRRRIWHLVWAAIPTLGFLVLLAPFPGGFLTDDGEATGRLTLYQNVVFAVAEIAVAVSFGLRWIRSRPGPYRTQILYILLPYLLWLVNDGMMVFVPTTLGNPFVGMGSHPLLLVLRLMQLAAVLAIVGFTLWRRRHRIDEASTDDVRLLAWFAAFFVLALPQVLVHGADHRSVHLATDGLFAPILFYAFARYHILDIDLKIKIGLRRSTVAAFFVATFLVVSQVAEAVAARYVGQNGWLLGALAAGLLLFVLSPVQRLAEQFSQRAMPNVEDTPQYHLFRRFELYKDTLEIFLADGHVSAKERKTLVRLQAKLGISPADAIRLEQAQRPSSKPS